MKKTIIVTILGLLAICSVLYALTIRGSLGIPTPAQIGGELSLQGRPFETSQERSRYVIILSLVNNRSIHIDPYAALGTPDVGRINGHYYSFFPPLTSILAIPLYLLGLYFGATQMFVFSISTLFAILTMVLIVLFCFRLNMHWSLSLFAAFSFGFATNAWGYSVTLYAHLVSAFFLLLGLYLVSFLDKKRLFLKGFLIWLLYGIAVFVDFPNAFIYLPIVVLLTRYIASVVQTKKMYKISVNPKLLIAPFIFIFLMVFYGYYNYVLFGSPMRLSNSIPRVTSVSSSETKTASSDAPHAISALQTRNMLKGLISFTISYDRGILVYSPIVLLCVLAFGYLKGKKQVVEIGLFALPLTCFTLYSMFDDPYGGWAFGSRYMIAVMPELSILSGLGLMRLGGKVVTRVLYSFVFLYSSAISLLSPLTTNLIPPYVEAQTSGLDSSYIINLRMLEENTLNSYFYNHILQGSITGDEYYFIILAITAFIGLSLIWFPRKYYEKIT